STDAGRSTTSPAAIWLISSSGRTRMALTGRVYRIAPVDLLLWLWNLAVHLDQQLEGFVAQYGTWVYGLLFVIVFCETGLVVTPFLPGDSLLFVAGAVAAIGKMNIAAVVATLIAAALCGDNVNYWVGRFVGPRVFTVQSRWLNARHLKRAHDFY